MPAATREAVASGSGPASPPSARTGRRGVWRLVLPVLAAVIVGLLIGRVADQQTADAEPDFPRYQPDQPGVADELQQLQAQAEGGAADPTTLHQLAAAAVEQAALTGDPGTYAVAEQALAEAAEADPDGPVTLIGQGHLALALHEFAAALDFGQRALRQVPGNEDALAVLVDANIELGRYGEAERHLQALLDRSPALPALSRTSYLRELRGDLAGARRAMRQARVAGGGDAALARVDLLLGDLSLQTGDLRQALDSYAAAAELAPAAAAPHVGRARALTAAGEYQAAADVLRGVTATTAHPDALLLLADLERSLGNTDSAADVVELVRAGAALQERAGQVVDLEMAVFEADHGDPSVAVERARAAHEVRPDNVFAQDALAWASYREGKTGKAAALAEDALRLGTRDPDVVAHAALIAAADGDETAARERLRRLPWLGALPPLLRAEAGELADRLGVAQSELPR